jgi:CTP:molybdopterin cytidylyltransferase MocA
MTTAAVVLAAGAGTRFGGGKLLAPLRGQPIVAHVVDAARAAGLEPIVIVVPPTGELDDLELGVVRRVMNPNPAEGLSSSVRLGLRALELDTDVEAVVILPGDQPLVRPEVIRSLLAAPNELPATPFVVASYADDGAPNPILARRSIWRLADELAGDRGFGPVLAAHPELVRVVPVDGANPDIDTLADLAAIGSARPATGRRFNRRPPGDVS